MKNHIVENYIDKERLADYLIALSLDPSKLDGFEDKLDVAIANYELSQQEKDILVTRDAMKIHQALSGDTIHAAMIVAIVAIIVIVNTRCT